ncbi:unnamed protein product [Adineta ricciae]|uniref:Uncharacterized protein n=1 Tax=Adineta ricciae TaxID=249248 RepID=A0A815QYM7_ADIRI|nr:unnamed protein product [Adineta ricciae]CAF1525800.1 unnamed protein product [Adineta ricciae]
MESTRGLRVILTVFWQIVGDLSNTIRKSWNAAAVNLNASQFLSSIALDEEALRIPVHTTFNNFIDSYQIAIIRDLLAIHLIINAKQLVVSSSNKKSTKIPGITMDCLTIDATFASTRGCYYNQTCLSLLHSSLPINIRPLANISPKYFSTNSIIQTVLNELMNEEMISYASVDLYYSQCTPQYFG